MLYSINSKYYIKVQGHYKEVNVNISNDELVLTPNGNEIEAYNVQANQVSIEQLKQDIKFEKTNKKKW